MIWCWEVYISVYCPGAKKTRVWYEPYGTSVLSSGAIYGIYTNHSSRGWYEHLIKFISPSRRGVIWKKVISPSWWRGDMRYIRGWHRGWYDAGRCILLDTYQSLKSTKDILSVFLKVYGAKVHIGSRPAGWEPIWSVYFHKYRQNSNIGSRALCKYLMYTTKVYLKVNRQYSCYFGL